jgi:hypothetical protein
MAVLLTYVALQHGGGVLSEKSRKEHDMHEPNFWASSADAMEMSVEGNRLIAREIASLFRGIWHRSIRLLDEVMLRLGQHGHLPPV